MALTGPDCCSKETSAVGREKKRGDGVTEVVATMRSEAPFGVPQVGSRRDWS